MDLTVQAIHEAARRAALKAFGRKPDAEERIADVQSVAWELSLTASDRATPGTLARYAVRRVTIRRQYRESVRCLETVPKDKNASRHEFRRVAFDAKCFASRRNDPAEIAAFRIDLPAWLATLPPLKRQAAKLLAFGERNSTVAKRLNISPARVTQIRYELAADWIAMHS